MNLVQKIALSYIALVVVAVYSYSVGRFQVFPYEFIEGFVQNYRKFAAGDEMERKTSVATKLKSDLMDDAGRWAYDYPEVAAVDTQPSDRTIFARRDEGPRVFVDPNHREGYRFVVGVMRLRDSFWGALLLNPEGEIIHSWNLSTGHLQAKVRRDQMKNLYGVHLFPDGSVIYLMQEFGGGIVKVDACSNILWNLQGKFHHAISPDEHGYFWSFSGLQRTMDQNMVKVSVDTGEIVEKIRMADIRRANPTLHIWDLVKYGFDDRSELRKTGNMTHGNDIEPLPQALAEDFPGFNPGDLVISYATNNLILVLDPESLKIKWWRIGAGDLQHDPDWEPGGIISLLSNNPRTLRKGADIVAIDTATLQHRVILPGKRFDFATTINGRHQLTPFGTRFVTSSQQGWAFEVDSGGDIVFSFVNTVDSAGKKALHLSEAVRLEADYFDTAFWQKCR